MGKLETEKPEIEKLEAEKNGNAGTEVRNARAENTRAESSRAENTKAEKNRAGKRDVKKVKIGKTGTGRLAIKKIGTAKNKEEKWAAKKAEASNLNGMQAGAVSPEAVEIEKIETEVADKKSQNLMNLIRRVHGMVENPDIEKHRQSQDHIGAILSSAKALNYREVDVDGMYGEWVSVNRAHMKK